jgi:L-rhamnose mutarotase
MAYADKSRYVLIAVDNNSQTSQTSFKVDSATLEAQLLAFRDAFVAITEGPIREYGHVITQEDEGILFSTVTTSDTRHKWRVLYQDVVTQKQFTVTIGIAKPSVRMTGFDEMDLTTGVGATFKAQFANVVLSPEGNATRVLRIDYI